MSVIDDYLQQVDPIARTELERIRSITRAVLPDSEEVIMYGMPTIRLQGKAIIGFDAHKNHIGIYPYSSQVIATIEELGAYDTTKGAIREKLGYLLPNVLIEKIIRERLKQVST